MTAKINYLWRLLGTAISFTVFGLIAMVFWGLAFPVIDKLIIRNRHKKQKSRLLMQQIFHIYMEFMRLIGILDYQVYGSERLNAPGKLIIANHPCLLDIVFLISQIKNATCIVKPQLANNPFLRIPIHAMGYIYAHDPEKLLELCSQELRTGCSLIIFPEGTRTIPGKPLKFQRGAAAIALHAKVNLLPVTLSCTPTTLTKQEKWYQIPDKKFTLSLHADNELQTGSTDTDLSRSLATRKITRQLEQYFTRQQVHHGQS
jgi:1-acyl-sn-glycerol-3-phosphate acyltransferase